MNTVFIKRTASLKSAVIEAEQMLSGRIWLFICMICIQWLWEYGSANIHANKAEQNKLLDLTNQF